MARCFRERGKYHGVVRNAKTSKRYATIAKRIAIEMFFSRSFEIPGVIGQELINLLSDDWGVNITAVPERDTTVVDCGKMNYKGQIATACSLSADYANTASKLVESFSIGNGVCIVRWPLQDEEEVYALATKLAFHFKVDICIDFRDFYCIATINLKNITSNLYGSVDGKRVFVKNKHLFLEKHSVQ